MRTSLCLSSKPSSTMMEMYTDTYKSDFYDTQYTKEIIGRYFHLSIISADPKFQYTSTLEH